MLGGSEYFRDAGGRNLESQKRNGVLRGLRQSARELPYLHFITLMSGFGKIGLPYLRG